MIEMIGSVVGFPLGASVRDDTGYVSVAFGTVILRNGAYIGYGAASASVSVSHYSTDTFRAFMLDPELADPDINLKQAPQSQARRALTLQLDTDTSLPRGAYEGGLIVLGDVTFKRPEPSQPEKPLGTTERNSLLRVIRALDVMANLPDRGAASSIEHRLHVLGFTGPIDDTIRPLLRAARELAPDEKPNSES